MDFRSLTGQCALLNELVAEYTQPALDAAKLTAGSFDLLAAIEAAGEPTTQINLARRLGVRAPTLSEAVSTAIRKGLVTQEPHPTDRRAKRLRLTAKGRRALGGVLAAVAEAEAHMIRGIPDSELAHMEDLLRRLARNLAGAPRLAALS